MSAAACKQTLCGWDAISAVDSYMIDQDAPSKGLRKAAAVVKDYLQQAIDLALLLTTEAAGGFNRRISLNDAGDIIEIMEAIETQLAGKNPADAKTFLEAKSGELHAALKAEHDCVTGETTAY